MKIITNIFSAPCIINMVLAIILYYILIMLENTLNNNVITRQFVSQNIGSENIKKQIKTSIIVTYIFVYLLSYNNWIKTSMFLSTTSFIPISLLAGILLTVTTIIQKMK